MNGLAARGAVHEAHKERKRNGVSGLESKTDSFELGGSGTRLSSEGIP